MLGDLWPESDRESGKEEPDYIKTEREQFSSFRDLNKDGKMDRVGIVEWFYLYGSLILFPSIIEVVEGDSCLCGKLVIYMTFLLLCYGFFSSQNIAFSISIIYISPIHHLLVFLVSNH